MKKRELLKKGCIYMLSTSLITGAFTMPVFASWVKDDSGLWKYSTEQGYATGWQEIDGKWYFLSETGEMLSGLVRIDGKVYYLGTPDSGAMVTGKVELNGIEFEFSEDGEAVGDAIPDTNIEYTTGSYTGWKQENGIILMHREIKQQDGCR